MQPVDLLRAELEKEKKKLTGMSRDTEYQAAASLRAVQAELNQFQYVQDLEADIKKLEA